MSKTKTKAKPTSPNRPLRSLLIADLDTTYADLARAGERDPFHVVRIKKAYEEGKPIPPVTVVTWPGGGWLLADGGYRRLARVAANATRIPCEVVECRTEDAARKTAHEIAAGSNEHPGKPRVYADVAKMAESILTSPYHVGLSRFAGLPREYAGPGTTFETTVPSVAKWGEWHCGEGKERFDGTWAATEPTLIEPFLDGEAVRVTAIGDRLWQVCMGGDGWKKSIHGAGAAMMSLDAELADDVRRMRDHFDLAVCAADYIVTAAGEKHLLELNHVPNVTEFPEVREAYLSHVADWVAQV